MSDSRFETFLAKIYVDENARVQFLADPRGEAIKAGLTKQQVEDVVKIDRAGLEMFAASLKRKKQSRR
jgi:phosphoribosylformylglycinamidine (FGAM) synthase PurS component